MSRRVALWIVGEPGLGKTTIARALLAHPVALHPSPKWTLTGWDPDNRSAREPLAVVAAGHYTGEPYDGADQVPYSGAAPALEFWREVLAYRSALTIFDGDRFSHAAAVEFVSRLGIDALCVHLATTDEYLGHTRRVMRGGRLPSPSWLKGRVTKSSRFASTFDRDGRLIELPAAWSSAELVQAVRTKLGL